MGKKLTQEEFIEKAKLKHDDKYDYSMVEYIGSRKKVIIICKEHGEFNIQPNNHLFGQGCLKCSIIKKTSLQDNFIKNANLKHNDKYDYSKVNYINAKTKVIIICKEHGEFLQKPNGHLNNGGCIKCSIQSKRLIHENFIEKCLAMNVDKYNYSKTNYINMKIKIIIICKEHGEFLQNPNNHLNGQGCFYCASDDKKSNIIEFMEKAKLKHNDKYDYSLVNYINISTKVNIICKEHGIFLQTPNIHLSGSGCPKCNKSFKMNSIDFIRKSILKHNDRYDYSSTIYFSSTEKVSIICKKHGVFKQSPVNHLFDNGCPKCGTFYGIKENKWLDSFKINMYRQFRIGKYTVDGYDPKTNTVYEFNGDYWHGNPSKYNSSDINKSNKKTFGELYIKTLEKEEKLKELGYNVISIWESDFLKEKVLS